MDAQQADEIARARLAYVSAGRPPLCAPRRAAPSPPDEAPATPLPAGIPGEERPLGPPRRLTRQHLLVVAVLLLCAVGVAVAALSRSAATEVPLPAPSAAVSLAPASASPPPLLRVHVAGAVMSPGVVNLPAGSIVLDAIEAAGGLHPSADPAQLNLAAPVSDGVQIVIGTAGTPLGELHAPAGEAPLSGGGSGLLDLNRATTADLEELPGIGPVTAGAITQWREEHGPFTAVEELQEISGIGPKTFDKLRPLVTVG